MMIDQETWRNHYITKKTLTESTYKSLPCFHGYTEINECEIRLCYPVPLMESLTEIYPSYTFSGGNYSVEAMLEKEELFLRIEKDENGYSLCLQIEHDETDRVIHFYVVHSHSFTPVNNTSITSFLKNVYKVMFEFMVTHSPYRLALVTHEYEVNLPNWLGKGE